MSTRNATDPERAVSVETETAPPAVPPARRRRWWPWLVLGLVVLAVWAIHAETRQAAATAQAPARPGAGPYGRGAMMVPVVAATAHEGDLPVYLDGLGSVTPLNTVTVRSRVDGQLVSVNFKEGQLVHKGELLARIDSRPFEVQLTQAQGQLAKDQATLKNAQMDLQRYQVLYAQDAVPKQQLDTAQATVNQYEGTIQSDQGAIESARLNLTYSRITAPLTGRIGLRLVDPGNIVHASDPNGLVVITERQPIAVLFAIPEDSLPAVLQHMRGGTPLAVEAWDRDMKNRLATGTLLTVDNEIDQATGTVRLKAVFANQDDALFPNQFVNTRLLVDTVHDTVIVPAAAIQRNQQSTFVYLVRPDNTIDMRTVDVRLTEGDETAVSSGLAQGDRVVIEGVDKLQQGTRVAVRDMNGVPSGTGGPQYRGARRTSAPGAGRNGGARTDGAARSQSQTEGTPGRQPGGNARTGRQQ